MACTKLHIFLLVFVFLLSACSTTRRSTHQNYQHVTDSISRVQVRHDTLWWYGNSLFDEQMTITVSRFDTISNTWIPEKLIEGQRSRHEERGVSTAATTIQSLDGVQEITTEVQSTDSIDLVADVSPSISSAIDDVTEGVKWFEMLLGIGASVGASIAIILWSRRIG